MCAIVAPDENGALALGEHRFDDLLDTPEAASDTDVEARLQVFRLDFVWFGQIPKAAAGWKSWRAVQPRSNKDQLRWPPNSENLLVAR